MDSGFRELYGARNLFREWTGRTIRARYQQSALGWLWAVMQPGFTAATFAVVFTVFVPVDTGGTPYVLFAYAAIVPWTLLSASLADMTGSLVQNMNLITKIYFPREVLPLAALCARLLDFCVAAGLMVVLMLYFHVPNFVGGWVCIPVILLIQLALVAGLGLACAALNVFYRDVQSVLTLALQMWFYASPVIYPSTLVPAGWRPLYFLNPMAGIIEAYRDVLLNGRLPGWYLLGAAVVSSSVLVAAHRLFRHLESQFADIV